ncbi:sigma-70 family RNA polymerase sigma factor [Dongia deserti]|uniref:sigma-70 family RNA polymerase sigma factor n=1 Tax=Dongia deserti TaxID=2268030 RepID=UPI000E6524B7|nr:sigma-70 family RNA polymerase sigma factor [Dongia deserti]
MTYDSVRLDLFLAHRSALIDYAQPIVGCRARAEDVVQEAYLRFAAATERADDTILQPVGYLYRIVRNLALDWARHLAQEDRPPPGAMERLASAAPSPEQATVDRDQLRIVIAALDELPPRTRRAFELNRLQGETFPAIARQLGISVGLAHRLVKDALTHCADRLGGFES